MLEKPSDRTSYGGIGLFTIIGLIFLTLKLSGLGVVASWSWWWVTSPFWMPVVFVLVIIVIIAIVGSIVLGIRKIIGR